MVDYVPPLALPVQNPLTLLLQLLGRPSDTRPRLTASLKVDIGYFFRDEEKRQFVISYRGGRKNVPSQRGYDVETLVEDMDNHFMDPVIVSLKGKDEEDTVELAMHEGQEFMYVLEGKVEVILGSKRFVLKQGDAAYWNGNVPHKGISLSRKPAKTLNVHLIPGTRTRTGTFAVKNRG